MASPLWTRKQTTPFEGRGGPCELSAYSFPSGSEHVAMVFGRTPNTERPLVRVQSACLTGTAFGALLCDCRQQLELSIGTVASRGGVVLYLDQEGRGYGLVEKVRQLAEISSGSATTASAAPDPEADIRRYDEAFAILDDVLGARSVRLLTNNPKKLSAFRAAGFDVERAPVEVEPTSWNREYLRIKKEQMGHLLSMV